MRTRTESLRTGNMLTWFDPNLRARNRSLLFLIAGAAGIRPMTCIEHFCRALIAERGWSGFEWLAVPDAGQLAAIDSEIDPAHVTRVEAIEFDALESEELSDILGPAVERLMRGDPELFPSASGAVGGPARGIQFLDRQDDVRQLLGRIRSGKSCLLVAPRRSGKTSLLCRLEEELSHEMAVIFLDLQRDFSPQEVAARIWSQASGVPIRAAQQRVEREPWSEVMTSALRRLGPEKGRGLVLLLDEIVFLLSNLASRTDEARHQTEVTEILGSLAAMLRKLSAVAVVTGSSDLDGYLRDGVGLDTSAIPPFFRELAPYYLRPLSAATLPRELRRVLLGSGLIPEEGDADWLREHVDLAMPYVGLRFLDELAGRVRARGRLTTLELEAELQRFLTTTDAFREFEEQLSRKEQELRGARAAVRSAFDRLAPKGAEEGCEVGDLRAELHAGVPGKGEELLSWLVGMFPVEIEGHRIRFVSRLFRRWWAMQL